MRLLGLDYGARRIGLAVAESSDRVAVGAGTVTVRSPRDAVAAIRALVRERVIDRIVVGLPISMNGQESQQTARTRAFAKALSAAVPCPIALQDERLTSRAAARSGAAGGSVDERSAVLLLQAYLDEHSAAEQGGRP